MSRTGDPDGPQLHSDEGRPSAGGASSPIDYEDLRRQLARSVGRLCRGWLVDRREDIVQSAILRVMTALEKSEYNPAVPASYVWKVAYTATVDEIRRSRRGEETSFDPQERPVRSTDAGSDPHRAQEGREMGRAIRDCLARLHERRRLVVGFHLMGHTVVESVRLLGWNRRKVQNLLFRGIADLRQCLTSKGFTP